MTAHLQFDPIRLPPECDALRTEVRAFLAEESAAGTFDPHQAKDGDAHSRAFSRRVGAKGWIGMTWPKKYGGREKSFLDKINKALAKIDDGTFGTCEECGEDISIKRLEARPETTLCIRCKEDQERMEKDYG